MISGGASDAGFAQNLANKMGVPVEAPTDLVWAGSARRQRSGLVLHRVGLVSGHDQHAGKASTSSRRFLGEIVIKASAASDSVTDESGLTATVSRRARN